MQCSKETGLVTQTSVLVALIVIVLAFILVYFIYMPPLQQSESGNSGALQIGNWNVYVNNEKTKIIYAQTQENGMAVWSGEVKVIVYNWNGTPMKNVKVLLNGCGILKGGLTDENGTVVFHLHNVTLPSGSNEGKISLQISYEKSSPPQLIQDSLTVLRKF